MLDFRKFIPPGYNLESVAYGESREGYLDYRDLIFDYPDQIRKYANGVYCLKLLDTKGTHRLHTFVSAHAIGIGRYGHSHAAAKARSSYKSRGFDYKKKSKDTEWDDAEYERRYGSF